MRSVTGAVLTLLLIVIPLLAPIGLTEGADDILLWDPHFPQATVWRTPAALNEGIVLQRNGHGDLAAPLAACVVTNGTRALVVGATSGLQVVVTEGPARGCRGFLMGWSTRSSQKKPD